MKKERNECFVALSRGTRNKLNRAVFKSMLVATNFMHIESGLLHSRVISPYGDPIIDEYDLEIAKMKNLKIKKRLLGYTILFDWDDGYVYKLTSNFYVIFAEDKNQREELEQFITALRRAAHVEL